MMLISIPSTFAMIYNGIKIAVPKCYIWYTKISTLEFSILILLAIRYAKGGLISESFLSKKKNVQNHYSEQYLPKQNMLRIVICHIFFGDGGKVKKENMHRLVIWHVFSEMEQKWKTMYLILSPFYKCFIYFLHDSYFFQLFISFQT